MRRAPPPDLVLVAAALAAVAALLLLARVLDPPRVGLADLPGREGERVAVEARVLQARAGAHGAALVVADGKARATALTGPGAPPSPGDVVRIVGVVARLSDGLGLSVERLDVIERAASRPLSPADLARDPEAFDGARVLVRGEARDGDLVGGGARVRLSGVPPPGRGPWLAAGELRYAPDVAAYVLRVASWSPPS